MWKWENSAVFDLKAQFWFPTLDTCTFNTVASLSSDTLYCLWWPSPKLIVYIVTMPIDLHKFDGEHKILPAQYIIVMVAYLTS